MPAAITALHAGAAKRYPPGDLAVWIFILAELLVFALFFTAYAFARLQAVALFYEFQQHLDHCSAFVNTLALLTSSYFVVCAVAVISENNSRACMRWPVTLWLLIPGGLISLTFILAN